MSKKHRIFSLLCAATAAAPLGHASAPTDFRPTGPNLLADTLAWVSPQGHMASEAGVTRLSAPESGTAFVVKIPVEPGKEYFFAASVKSGDRLVAFLGGLSMSYHAQGAWQRVAGLVRSNQNAALELKLDLRPLAPGRSAQAEIKDLVLQQVERPAAVVPRERSGDTPLVATGKPAATIVYPEKTGKALAEKIQSAIREKTGAELPLLSDREATEAAWPILRPALKNENLIIIGNLGTNHALWPAYNRFLAAEDGYYPGGDGYAIRTAANIFANGKNQIVLGGSSDTGTARAVEQFLKKLNDLPEGDSLTLPWLLDVELGGECKAAFEADNALWQNPDDPALPAQTSGYGKVTRWYRNAMGYYWSGWPQYLEREKANLQVILSERAHTHHYIAEFMVRTYGMLRDSPAFDPAQVAGMDALILQNFLDFLTVTDLSWMTVFSPPYSGIPFRNRHQLAPWYADLVMARFLRQNVKLGGMLKELVDFRFSEKDAAFRAFAASRSGPSQPGIAAGSDYEEFPAAFFRYALENDLYPEFVGSGLAHQTLGLDRLNVAGARYAYPPCDADVGMWLGAMAQLTDDARYQWLNKNIPFPPSSFQGRYVAGVHRYQPGADFPVREPSEWTGIQIAPQPHKEDQTPENDARRFPHVTLRSGFSPRDDNLIVAGVTPDFPSGALIRLEANGVAFLGGSTGAISRATANSASAVRLDHFNIDAPPPPDFAELLWKEQLPNLQAFAIRAALSSDMDWDRAIVRLANGRFIFRDTFRARHAGRYLLSVNWRTPYSLQPSGDVWQIITNKGILRIEKIGNAFAARQADPSLLSWESVREMKEGETATVWTLTQTLDDSRPLLSMSEARKTLTALPVLGDFADSADQPHQPHSASISDESAQWAVRWTYDGLLRPVLLTPQALSDDLVDFGQPVSLAEIRTNSSGRFWKIGTLPAEIFAGESAEDLRRIDAPRVSRPGVKTGNYGEATPVDSADESLFPKDIRVRFVKATGAAGLQYFGSDERAVRHPVRLRLITDLPDQKSLLLADNGRFPAFPRLWRDDDFSLALLRPETGEAITQIDINGPVQGVLVADQRGKGEAEIFVLRMDVRIDTFSLHGEPREPIDLYAQSADFQKRFGHDNIRAPAGGHYMPFSFGLWRPDAKGARKWVIGRYGSIAFLDQNRKFEGILNFPSYASPALLPAGMDFDGDGKEEVLLLERFNLVQISGNATPRVREPGGTKFWPQVYEQSAAGPKGIDSALLSGAPVHAFQVLKKFGGKPQFIFVVRGNYAGLYDAVSRKWTLSWQPPAPITAAALLHETEQRIEFCLATMDGLFWTVTLDSRRPGKSAVSVKPLPLSVNQIQPDGSGSAVLAAREGLFLYSAKGTFSKIFPGVFTSALFIQPGQIGAANERGQVFEFFQKP